MKRVKKIKARKRLHLSSGASVGWSIIPYTKIMGSILGQGANGRQPIDVSLSYRCISLSLSFPSSLSLKSIKIFLGEDFKKYYIAYMKVAKGVS